MERFSALPHPDIWGKGFHEHCLLNIDSPIEPQLRRRRLDARQPLSLDPYDNHYQIKRVISENSSLRINFGWSFEALKHLHEMMNECVELITPKYNEHVGNIITDRQCSWVGFMPFNIFDKATYDDLSTYSLVEFNNEMINFQVEVVKFIANHRRVRYHALLQNDRYRFNFYKPKRKNVDELILGFHFFIEAIRADDIDIIPIELIEDSIGCHFLYHPELFFELMNFYILKGVIDAK